MRSSSNPIGLGPATHRLAYAAALAVLGISPCSTFAATVFWNGSEVSNNWSVEANWSDSVAGADAVFNDTDPTTAGVVNNVVDADITLNSLTYQQANGNWHVTEISAGATLTLTGTTTPFPGDSPYQNHTETLTSSNVFRVGTHLSSANTTNVGNLAAHVEITGAGRFDVDAPDANFVVSSYSTNAGNSNTSMVAPTTLDMSGLADFSANVNNFWVGTGRASKATVYLADTNTITAASTVIGRTLYRLNQPTGTEPSTVYLGTTNTLNTETLYVGAENGTSNAARNYNSGVLAFASGLEGATLRLRGQAGLEDSRVAAMYVGSVGNVNDSSNSVATGMADFTGGSVDAMVSVLQIGFGRPSSESASSTGTLKINAGTFDATTVRVGYGTGIGNVNGGPRGTVTGNLDISGGTFIAGTMTVGTKEANNIRSVVVGNVNVSGGVLSSGNITLGNHGYLSTFPNDATATGTLNITGGTANVSGTILEGTSGTPSYNHSTVNVTGGALNMIGATRTISVDFLNIGSGGTVTGLTTFSGGRLDLDGALTTTALSIASGARIGGEGEIAGDLTLASGALFVFDPDATLTVSGTVTLDDSFSIASLVNADGSAIDWAEVSDGVYTLIDTASTFDYIQNFSLANAADIGGGRTVHFENGGLKLVVVPEPSAVMLMGLGMTALLGRRRRT